MNKKHHISILLLVFASILAAQDQPTDFTLYNQNTHVRICYCSNDHSLYSMAAHLLAKDIEQVTGYLPEVLSDPALATGNVILIGNIDDPPIKQWVGEQSAFYQTIQGKWETYGLTVLENVTENTDKILIITGSDHRGTAYGVFSISEKIGVSPWAWWADVLPEQKEELMIRQEEYISKPPSIKYRGIFLNDEDWGLQPWAANTFEAETGDIGPKTYAKVFELLLRLKANLIWPAMHNCTRAFFHYSENITMAKEYGIIIGSSHAEPMLRNNVDEWDKSAMGEFNYRTNKETVQKYWEERAMESKTMEAIYTLGMRGVHDSGIEGFKDMPSRVAALEQIITDQRQLLHDNVNRDVTSVPQVFIPYKEVLEIYDSGLILPDDITLVWPDDNYGYIQRLSNRAERQRSGGSGVYYHISYWGRPHDYLWLSSTHPVLIREEMKKAYQCGARKLWVVNVGDIKPAEYNMQLFLDMAYDIESFNSGVSVWEHHQTWVEVLFPGLGEEITKIYRKYYHLCFQRRPEFMGWNQVENQTIVSPSEYNHFYYGDEAQKRTDGFNSLVDQVNRLKSIVPLYRQDAFFELVEYPVKCASWMNIKSLSLEKAYLYAGQGRISANDYAKKAEAVHDSMVSYTEFYNNQLAEGKWAGMMSMSPRNLPVFEKPLMPSWIAGVKAEFEICHEGFTNEAYKESSKAWILPGFYQGSDDSYFVDVYLKGTQTVKWNASASPNWIRLSQTEGVLSNKPGQQETRIWVSVDWQKVPEESGQKGLIIISGNGKERKLSVSANTWPEGCKSSEIVFYEMNKYVSIWAEHYSRCSRKEWQILEGLGYTGNILGTAIDFFNDTIRTNNVAWVEYDFYSTSRGICKVNIYCIPVHPLTNNHELRLAVSIDGEGEKTVNYKTYGRSEPWKQNVLSNNAMQQAVFELDAAGKHTLTIKGLDPSVLIDRIEMDFGGLKKAYSVIQETKINGQIK